jgi:phosphotransferase system HPr (HPr) family protein
MFEQETVIKNPMGLHARPAAQLSAFCKSFPNEIAVSIGERKANPKSIFSLLAGGFKKGETVLVSVKGTDADEVGKQVVAFINALEE